MFYELYGSEVPDPKVSLNKRDLLVQYGIPVEAWIDLRILETWFKKGLPIHIVCLLNYVLSLQREDGSFSVDDIVPNSGATYRAIELALLLGLKDNSRVRKAVDYLINSLHEGGLASPGPFEGALLEVGTTARFLHILCRIDSLSYRDAVESMRSFILSRAYVKTDEAAWHTDIPPNKIDSIDSCITGATSLALYALCLVKRKEDRNLVRKGVRWLISKQNSDGGWSDAVDGKSNVDNTFNAVRALITSKEMLDSDLRVEANRSVERAKEFIQNVDVHTLKAVSLRAMCLRASLLIFEDPLDKMVLECVESVAEVKDRWLSKEGHLYNEMLIAGIALTEWIRRADINLYNVVRDSRYNGVKELFSFPVEMPPLLPGYRDSVGERFLNFVAKARHGYGFVEKLSSSITVRDIVSLIMATILMIGIFISDDFLKALILPYGDQGVNIYSTSVVFGLYIFWLLIKLRFKDSFMHYVTTTTLSVLIAVFIVWGWLRYSDELVSKVITDGEVLPIARLIIAFSLILDVGRRLINVSDLDRVLLTKKRVNS